MKSFNQIDLDIIGVVEMSEAEQDNCDGGFLPLLVIGAVLLLTACSSGTGNNTQVGGTNNTQTNINCCDCDSVTVKTQTNGDKVYIFHR